MTTLNNNKSKTPNLTKVSYHFSKKIKITN